MKKASHLVIGSNSFLGVALTKKIVNQGEVVLGVYNQNTNNLYPEVSHISIKELQQLKDAFSVVYIVSAYVPNNLDTDVEQKLKDGNIKLVETITKQFENAKIVFCSSISVYKETEEVITENSALQPITPYANSKLLGEKIVAKHKKHSIVRISSMYGVNMKPTTFLPIVIQSALNKKKITLFGNGNRLQNYIHVDDVADYLYASGKSTENDVFLATANVSVANKDVASYIKSILTNMEIVFKGTDDSKSHVYNNTFTKNTLFLEPKKELKLEIENLITWMKNVS